MSLQGKKDESKNENFLKHIKITQDFIYFENTLFEG